MLDNLAKKLGDEKYDPTEKPAVLANVMMSPLISVSDPDVVRDLMTVRNKQIEKNGINDVMTNKLLGNSFLFSKTDELWKAKRKACAHAFYKDRLTMMMHSL